MPHVRPSNKDKVLLLLDNHYSHVTLETIDYAKEHGIVLLSFPPHCSHKLQPLDRAVYGPFKRYYNSACDCWMKENKGKTMTIYDIPDMVGRAFPKAFTPVNIQSGFKVARIFPFDRDIFSDLEFLLSDVTDRLVPSADTDNVTQSKYQQLFNEQPQLSKRPSSSTNQFILNVTPKNIRPFTKAAPRKRKSCTNRGKTRIVTDTPEKNQIITNAEKKNTTQEICKCILNASIESGFEEASSLLLSEEENCSNNSTTEDKELSKVTKPSEIKEKFTLVRLYAKKSVRYYVGQVINVFEDGDVTFRFLKRSYHSALVSERPTFIFPEDTNDASKFTHSLEDIVFKLPVPLKKGEPNVAGRSLTFLLIYQVTTLNRLTYTKIKDF